MKIVNLILNLLFKKQLSLMSVSHLPLCLASSSKHLFKVLTENLLICRGETKQEMNEQLFLPKSKQALLEAVFCASSYLSPHFAFLISLT